MKPIQLTRGDMQPLFIKRLCKLIEEKVHYSTVKNPDWYFPGRTVQIKELLSILLENYRGEHTWIHNQTLTDYLTSDDVSTFLIGYELLKKEESYVTTGRD